MQPFIDSVVALDKADSGGRRNEFKRFVNEFGTHYASTTEMGTREGIACFLTNMVEIQTNFIHYP